MSKKAVDAVLLPDKPMTEKAININRELVSSFGRKIVLDAEKCLPHISLAMGCLRENDIKKAGNVLKHASRSFIHHSLTALGIVTTTNAVGEKISTLEIEKSPALQKLHENIMKGLQPLLSRKVTKQMLYNPEDVSQSTLLWIKNYREKSSFENFFPHITLGYGEVEKSDFPVEFNASALALCHLGNHCTCRKILARVTLA